MKRIVREEEEVGTAKAVGRKQDQERVERDFEMFLREVEENEEVRREMALYKAREEKKTEREREKEREGEGMETEGVEEEGEDDGEEDGGEDLPEIDMEELLDEFDELSVGEEE